MSDGAKWNLAAALLIIILMITVYNLAKPVSYEDLAKIYAARCVSNKADGNWVGSMGISLEKFCKGAGDLQALQEERRDHPEDF